MQTERTTRRIKDKALAVSMQLDRSDLPDLVAQPLPSQLHGSSLELLDQLTQLSRMIVLKVLVAMVSLVVLTQSAPAQTSEGNPGSSKVTVGLPLCVVQVETADGKALTNATVVGVSTATNAYLNGTTIGGGDERFQTDDEGRFSLPWNDTNSTVMVANERGFSLAQSSDLVTRPKMKVLPWGKIEGRRMNCGQPVAGQRLKYRLAMSFRVGKSLPFGCHTANPSHWPGRHHFSHRAARAQNQKRGGGCAGEATVIF